MNRIILIGNGFDLAHGLKTSYKDFIDWYWGQWGELLIKETTNTLTDGLCTFTLKTTREIPTWYHYGLSINNPLESWNFQEVAEKIRQNKQLCDFTYHSNFFKEICQSVENKGWVDIENIYYSYLSKDDAEPEKLNEQLAIIRTKLIEYLNDVQTKVSKNLINNEILGKMKSEFSIKDISVSYMKQFSVTRDEFKRSQGKDKPFIPDKTFMLNFNYTTLADLYFYDFKREATHIHGNLSKPESVIFGYGDELDENHKTIVNKNDNEYLRNIKSVKYLESSNYRHLLEFIESSPFQIFIMGHSCGNSDRTLLNTLFEHPNCVSIKSFYYKKEDGSDNYIELVQNIYRNFTDMKLMRNRVVNKEFCEPLLSKDTTQSTGEESK